MPTTDDEFAEFETDQATFDAMMARAEPARIVNPPASRTVTVSMSDETRFVVTMPTGGFVSVSATASSSSGGAVTPAPTRFVANRRETRVVEGMAS